MQEVQGFLNGQLDYRKLEGNTGPLVYDLLHKTQDSDTLLDLSMFILFWNI